VHQLAVLVPFSTEHAAMRPVVARDAALQARIDTLLFRFEQPDDEPMGGVDMDRGFVLTSPPLLFPKTTRERKAGSDWRRLVRAVTAAYPSCLAVAVDYHF
jgi:hypothetical protein